MGLKASRKNPEFILPPGRGFFIVFLKQFSNRLDVNYFAP